MEEDLLLWSWNFGCTWNVDLALGASEARRAEAQRSDRPQAGNVRLRPPVLGYHGCLKGPHHTQLEMTLKEGPWCWAPNAFNNVTNGRPSTRAIGATIWTSGTSAPGLGLRLEPNPTHRWHHGRLCSACSSHLPLEAPENITDTPPG